MPRTNTVSVNTNVTPEQRDLIRLLAERDGGVAQYVRRLIREDAERRGESWPELIGRGKYPREKEE